jgi:transcriptional regulator GlxA family with amidase domain
MPNWFIHTEKPETIGVLLYPRFSNHCLANVVEPLRAANTLSRKVLYQWQFLTVDGLPVESSSGLPILPAYRLSDHPGGDYLFVLPSYDVRGHATPGNAKSLRSAAKRFQKIVGLDTGSWLLAAAGLLTGRQATIHWDEITSFSETFDLVEVVTDRFVIDRDILTCGGAMTAFDLVLDMISRTHGASLRLEVAAFFMHSDSERPQSLDRKPSGSNIVDRAVGLMLNNLETPFLIFDLAAKTGVTQRRLAAEFKSCLGASPQTVYKRLRLLSALRYAEQSNYSIAEIALRCGYQNPAAMTRAFVKEFGLSPTALRKL